MRISNIAAAAALIGAIGTAHANVVYNWQPLSSSGVTVTSGQLVFSDQAYRSGSAIFDQSTNYANQDVPSIYPDSPIIHTTLTFAAADEHAVSVTINPRSAINSPIYYLSGDFLFADDLLTGGFRSHDYESQYAMSSNADGLWNVSGVNSDQYIGTGTCSDYSTNYSCGTATGRWVMDASLMSDVPEPNGLALFALGVLGLIGWTFGRNRRA